MGPAARRGGARCHRGREVQVHPIKSNLKPPGTKRLKLKCDILLSTYAFKLNLRLYTVVPPSPPPPEAKEGGALAAAVAALGGVISVRSTTATTAAAAAAAAAAAVDGDADGRVRPRVHRAFAHVGGYPLGASAAACECFSATTW